MAQLRQAPRGIFAPLTAAEILELDAVLDPPLDPAGNPPPYAPLRVPAPDNLGQSLVTSRLEIAAMSGFAGPGYAGVPMPPPAAFPWQETATAVDKYLRLLCERVNSLCPRQANGIGDIPNCAYIGADFWMPPPGTYPPQAIRLPGAWDIMTHTVYRTAALWEAVQFGMIGAIYNIRTRMMSPHATDRSRAPAAQTSHIFIHLIDERYGPGTDPHHSLVVISPQRKTIDYLDDVNGLQSLNINDPMLGHYNPDQKLIGHILNFFSGCMSRTTKNGNEFNPKHWQMRDNASAQNPLVGGRVDQATSAVMVCTNALMIATGYRLDYFRNIPAGMTQAGMIQNRRAQIALELHRGRLAVAPTPQFVPPMWPRQSPEFRYKSGSTQFKKLIARNARNGVVEELSRRDRARWYRGVAPKIDLDNIGKKDNILAYGVAQGYNARVMRPMRWDQLRDYVEEQDYLRRVGANGAPPANPPSY